VLTLALALTLVDVSKWIARRCASVLGHLHVAYRLVFRLRSLPSNLVGRRKSKGRCLPDLGAAEVRLAGRGAYSPFERWPRPCGLRHPIWLAGDLEQGVGGGWHCRRLVPEGFAVVCRLRSEQAAPVDHPVERVLARPAGAVGRGPCGLGDREGKSNEGDDGRRRKPQGPRRYSLSVKSKHGHDIAIRQAGQLLKAV
jgi:hypothetical protein